MQLSRPETGWSIGVFGALAEFCRDPGEDAEQGAFTVATKRGAIRLQPVDGCSAVPYEPRSAKHHGRELGIALCLSEAAALIERRAVITELGEDRDAINDVDRTAVLFDLGLGSPYVSFCVRTRDPELLRKLRASAGSALLDEPEGLFREIAAASPHRVAISRLGRIEVYQPIAALGGKTPDGPHTHLLPRLVKTGRMHSANALLPRGLVPCATYYP